MEYVHCKYKTEMKRGERKYGQVPQKLLGKKKVEIPFGYLIGGHCVCARMCMYMCVCTHVCVHVCVHMCVCVYACVTADNAVVFVFVCFLL